MLRAKAIPMPTSDEEFAALYHALADPVYARLTRLLGPIAEREDLVQHVFLKLHRALPTLRGEASVATVVHRITVNAAYDYLRTRQRRPHVSADDRAFDDLVADAPSPAVRTQRRQELAQLFEHLAALDPDKRIALVLVGVEGMSLREAAELVGASPDAVKQRVLSARRELAARIARTTKEIA